MLERAHTLLPERTGYSGASLCVIVTSGPRRQVLRPSEIEDVDLARSLHQEALFGAQAYFDPSQGVETSLSDGALILSQPNSSLLIDAAGSIRLVQLASARDSGASLPAIIEEDLREKLVRSLRLASSLLDRIDPVNRFTHTTPTVAILSASFMGWRTREEQLRSPNSMTVATHAADPAVTTLTPTSRPRAALGHEAPELADDFLTLLRRSFRQ